MRLIVNTYIDMNYRDELSDNQDAVEYTGFKLLVEGKALYIGRSFAQQNSGRRECTVTVFEEYYLNDSIHDKFKDKSNRVGFRLRLNNGVCLMLK